MAHWKPLYPGNIEVCEMRGELVPWYSPWESRIAHRAAGHSNSDAATHRVALCGMICRVQKK